MAPSIYRQYFEAIGEAIDEVKCAVEVNGKKCGTEISSRKTWSLQDHLQNVHVECYATIQASPKTTRQPNQSSLDSFAVVTPSKSPRTMRDLLMSFATSTASIFQAPKKRCNSPEDEQRQSVKAEFLSFYEEVCKKRRKFEDFWPLYKKQFPHIYTSSNKV